MLSLGLGIPIFGAAKMCENNRKQKKNSEFSALNDWRLRDAKDFFFWGGGVISKETSEWMRMTGRVNDDDDDVDDDDDDDDDVSIRTFPCYKIHCSWMHLARPGSTLCIHLVRCMVTPDAKQSHYRYL